ncbi:MAG: HAD-IIB family hydrolase [Pseudomonadota bacterium]
MVESIITARELLPVVFSDLDGTLLDHRDYTYAPALQALQQLQARNIPLILASSKTRAEMQPIGEDLGVAGLVYENGAGVYWPGDINPGSTVLAEDISYADIRQFMDTLPAGLRRHLKGLGDMTDAEVAAITGLPLHDARRARQREFTEPFVWSSTEQELLQVTARANAAGIRVTTGGRFNSFTGPHDKASRLREICSAYNMQAGNGRRVWSIALGDAPNDAEMLGAAQRGYIINNPDGNSLPDLPGEHDGRITRTAAAGPAGWNQSVLCALQEIDTMNQNRKGSANG